MVYFFVVRDHPAQKNGTYHKSPVVKYSADRLSDRRFLQQNLTKDPYILVKLSLSEHI